MKKIVSFFQEKIGSKNIKFIPALKQIPLGKTTKESFPPYLETSKNQLRTDLETAFVSPVTADKKCISAARHAKTVEVNGKKITLKTTPLKL